jgi:hypothetical protein
MATDGLTTTTSRFKPPIVPAAFFGIVLGQAGLGSAWRAAHWVRPAAGAAAAASLRGSWSSRSPHPIGVLRSAPPRRSAWPATAMPGRSPNLRRICSPVPIIAVGLITLGTLRLIVQRPFAVSSRAGSGQARSLSNQVAKVTSSG